MIVVFDTNVWVSAMHFEKRQGPPFLSLKLARKRDVIATCYELQEEIHRILVEKFGWDRSAARARLNFLLAKSVQVSITGRLHVCRDPNDDMVLECAVAAGAQCIVSGDKDLLALDPYNGIRIVSPAEFLALESSQR